MGKKKEELYQADLDLCNDVGPCFRFEQNKPKCSNCPLDKRLPEGAQNENTGSNQNRDSPNPGTGTGQGPEER